VTGSGKTFTIANIIESLQMPVLVISHNKTLAAQLYHEFKAFFPNNAVEFFVSNYDYYRPEAYIHSKNLLIDKDLIINEEIERLRLSTISSLLERQDVIVVATVSCLFGIGSPEAFKEAMIRISRGEQCNINSLLMKFIQCYYTRNDEMLKRGCFRVKGDVIEIWPSTSEYYYRIEFDWGVIDKIFKMDIQTGKVLNQVEEIAIYPSKQFIFSPEKLKRSIESIRNELEDRCKQLIHKGMKHEANRLRTRTEYDIEMLEKTGSCLGIENYSVHLSGRKPNERPPVLIDFFQRPFLTVVDECHITVQQMRKMAYGDEARKKSLIEYGFRLPSITANRPLTFEEFENITDTVLFMSATPGDFEIQKSYRVIEQIIRPTHLLDPVVVVRRKDNYRSDLYNEIKKRIEMDERTLVIAISKKDAEELSAALISEGIRAKYLHSEIETMERINIINELRNGDINAVVGVNILREGLDLPEVSLIAILDADKCGFLRTSTALIQIIGRASRHVNGTVIMYADHITNSMKEAINETNKRRSIQDEYNVKNNITPLSIKKSFVYCNQRSIKVRENSIKMHINVLKQTYDINIPDKLNTLINVLEEEFIKYANNLEFIEAKIIRDEINALKAL